jgi:TatD DNase family protein
MDSEKLNRSKTENSQNFPENYMPLLDMHAHLDGLGTDAARMEHELAVRRENRILTGYSAGNPREWELLNPYRKEPNLFFSYGIHPWNTGQDSYEDLPSAYREADLVGEIGLDSVWCEVDLALQKKQLERQLQIAADLGKPILLHTKGQEQAVWERIRDFPYPICVHWYSGDKKTYEKYLSKDCYFTLGPDSLAVMDPADRVVRERMIREISLERLFLETDGIGAVAWAFQKESMPVSEIPEVLRANLIYVSEIRGVSPEDLGRQMYENLNRFLDTERFVF